MWYFAQLSLDIDAASTDIIQLEGDQMDETKLIDISEICEQFSISSRTLRFYEEEGIIESTRVEGSARRKYSLEQIARIREVLTLRAIGISVKEIREYPWLVDQLCGVRWHHEKSIDQTTENA